jgi:hypothetical protein
MSILYHQIDPIREASYISADMDLAIRASVLRMTTHKRTWPEGVRLYEERLLADSPLPKPVLINDPYHTTTAFSDKLRKLRVPRAQQRMLVNAFIAIRDSTDSPDILLELMGALGKLLSMDLDQTIPETDPLRENHLPEEPRAHRVP